MKKTLKNDDIVRIIREEWDRKYLQLCEKMDVHVKQNGETQKDVVSVGLKVKKSNTKQLYTVRSLSPNEVELETPEKQKFTITREELGKDYEIA